MAKVKCPRCKSAMIQMVQLQQNYKQKTSLNLNPLHPFTLTNTKTVVKKSAGKKLLNIATGGLSGKVIGTDKNTIQYHCNNCGHVWAGR